MDIDSEIFAAPYDDEDDDDITVPSGSGSVTTTAGGTNAGRDPLSKLSWSFSLTCLLLFFQFLMVVQMMRKLSNTSHVPSMVDMDWPVLFSTLAH